MMRKTGTIQVMVLPRCGGTAREAISMRRKEAAVLAVDGGGTRCRAALCRTDGQILRYVQGGSCNYHSIGAEQATAVLTAVLAALTNNQALQIRCAVLGLAGLDTKKDRAALSAIVHNALAAAQIAADAVYLDNDALVILKGLVGGNNGVMLAVGTGSIACGITEDGREVRVGGWGYRIGDEGSGYAIGKAALVHILRAYDGREEPSGIATAVLRELALANEEELLNWVYSAQFSVQQLAALTPVILRLAAEGDYQALAISERACHELGAMTLTVVRKLDLLGVPFQLLLCGGVMQNGGIRRQLMELITCKCPQAAVLVSDYQPICAGLRYGLRVVGIENLAILNGLSGQLNNPAPVSEG
jgi:N-acetylglucosamine kinase-like BadF-type ATPase